MSDTIRITVDGRPAKTREGEVLLTVLRDMGVHVPTLCHHPSLEPSGACRLCVVEITHPDWSGWSGLVTSCLYPAEPGLQVSTRSEKVMESRRTLLELFLARCPDSEEVREVARAEGVDGTPFPSRPDADLCIMCGLCTRVCNDLGPAAIAPLGRGTEKTVGPRPDGVGEDCTACGACALVCPTDHIRMEHRDGAHHIWSREFPIDACEVVPDLCRGCGVCEENCPIAVPRVTLTRVGDPVAKIPPSACVGCGICAGACPTGAITQDGGLAPDGEDRTGRIVTYACSRSTFFEEPDGLVSVPCIGRVPVESMLENLAGGADGVLLLCRDQATCPHGLGGALARSRAPVADGLASAAGLGAGRIRYEQPSPGPSGPEAAWTFFRKSVTASPLRGRIEPAGDPGGLDRALEILDWLRSRTELESAPGESNRYRDLDRLLPLLIKDWRPGELADADPARDGRPFRFRIGADEKREILDRLRSSPSDLSSAGPGERAQARLLLRDGAWQEFFFGEAEA